MLPNACPKPERRKRTKGRALRAESVQALRVRALCVDRDGDCRLSDPSLWLLFGACSGESEWAHFADKRRFKTRGMAPEARHSTDGGLMLCTGHHDCYDGRARPRIGIRAASSDGADGRLAFCCGSIVHVEAERVTR